MTTFDRRAELQDISDQHTDRARAERGESSAAQRFATEWCPAGKHIVRSNGRGGGGCACGFSVDREEL